MRNNYIPGLGYYVDKDMKDKIVKLREQGLPVYVLARRFGISGTAVSNILAKQQPQKV